MSNNYLYEANTVNNRYQEMIDMLNKGGDGVDGKAGKRYFKNSKLNDEFNYLNNIKKEHGHEDWAEHKAKVTGLVGQEEHTEGLPTWAKVALGVGGLGLAGAGLTTGITAMAKHKKLQNQLKDAKVLPFPKRA